VKTHGVVILVRRLVPHLGLLASALACLACSGPTSIKSNEAMFSTCEGTGPVSSWRCSDAKRRVNIIADLMSNQSVRDVVAVGPGRRVQIIATGQIGRIMPEKAMFLSMDHKHNLLIVPLYLNAGSWSAMTWLMNSDGPDDPHFTGTHDLGKSSVPQPRWQYGRSSRP
jgi:hypothetical protein